MSELPKGWVEARVGDLGNSIKGSLQPRGDAMFELYSVPSFADGKPELLRGVEIGSHKRPVQPSDLLICKINPRINRVWVVGPHGDHEQLASPEWLVLRSPQAGLASMLRYQLSAPDFRRWIERGVHGVTGSHTRAKDDHILDFPTRVPPLAEQERIVAAIEEAFSKLDAGEAGLRTARQLLKRMRNAILTAAVTGRLVPQDPTDTPATKLLADLGVEPLDLDEPALPHGWEWATIESISAPQRNALAIGPFGSNLKVADYASDGVPLVFVRNIRRRDFRSDRKFVSMTKADELASHSVRQGDVLVTKMGDPPGDTAVYEEQDAAIITADCIKVTCGSAVAPEYLALAIAGGETRRRLLDATRGVAQKKVSLARFKVLPVAIPPIQEQQRIATEVDRQFSFLDVCERAVDTALAQSAALRRSVLKAAFEGKLVPQDPTDEPASELLDRIRAERAAAPKAKTRRARSKA